MRGSQRSNVEEEARLLVERLGGRWGPAGGLCRCPAHDDRTPSLSVRAGRTRMLLHCFAGCGARDVLRALKSAHLLEPGAATSAQAVGKDSVGALQRAARRIWSDSRPAGGTAAEHYLLARGLAVASPQLRFHPRAPRGRQPLTQFGPALIAAVRDDAGLIGIHRTFLAADGSGLAELAQPRAGLGRFGSGAVRLGPSGPSLGLAEGIETALSATALFGVPCWAALGTERFGRVRLPSHVKRLLLFLDHDSGGRRADALARHRFADLERIEAHYPDRPGDDWNDVLKQQLERTGRPPRPLEERSAGEG